MAASVPTRERILAGARLLMWAKGYEGVSVEEICVACKTLKGSFYHFFPTKEALLIQLIRNTWDQERAEIARIFAQPKPVQERVHDHVELYIAVQRRHYLEHGRVPGMFYLVLNANLPAAALQIVRENARQNMDYVVDALRESPEYKTVDHAALLRKVEVYAYCMIGAHVQARLINSLGPLEAFREVATTLLGLSV